MIHEPYRVSGGGFWLLRRQGSLLKGRVEARFGFGRRYVADGLEQAAVVEPVGPTPAWPSGEAPDLALAAAAGVYKPAFPFDREAEPVMVLIEVPGSTRQRRRLRPSDGGGWACPQA